MYALLVLASPLCGRAQFIFTTNNNLVTITGYNGPGGDVVIPNSTNGYPVTAIGFRAFYNKTSVTTVAIPNSVSNIDGYAFAYCGLPTATLPDSVINVNTNAFFFCSALTNVVVGRGVTGISEDAFGRCAALKEIVVNATNPCFTSSGGVLFNKNETTLIRCPGGFSGSYVIPSSIQNIGNYAFNYCAALHDVIIGNNVTNIGNVAFAYCSGLAQATIPDSVATIGMGAFSVCHGLTTVTFGSGVTSLGNNAFGFCTSLTNVTIPSSVTAIGPAAFQSCTSLHQAFFQGNAPSVNGGSGSIDPTGFAGESGTVYYVPGTTGWGTTFGSWPTAQWYQSQPQILGSGYGLGVRSNQFSFTISWATNTSVVIVASINLQSWTPVITNALMNGTNAFVDSVWTNYPQRFYRVRTQ